MDLLLLTVCILATPILLLCYVYILIVTIACVIDVYREFKEFLNKDR